MAITMPNRAMEITPASNVLLIFVSRNVACNLRGGVGRGSPRRVSSWPLELGVCRVVGVKANASSCDGGRAIEAHLSKEACIREEISLIPFDGIADRQVQCFLCAWLRGLSLMEDL